MEIDAGWFKETILEIVKVEQHRVGVELRLWVAVVPFQPARPAYLYVGQLAYRFNEQTLLPLVIASAGLTSALQGIEERHRAEILLQVTHLVVGDGKHTRHRQLPAHEMPREIHECVVLLTARAYDTYQRGPVCGGHPVILPVAARSGHPLRRGRHLSPVLPVQLDKFFHCKPLLQRSQQVVVTVTAFLLPLHDEEIYQKQDHENAQ